MEWIKERWAMAANYLEQVLWGAASFVGLSAAGVVTFFINRGVKRYDIQNPIETVPDQLPHLQPCEAHLKLEKSMEEKFADFDKKFDDIFDRLKLSEKVQMTILNEQIEMAKVMGDIKEALATLGIRKEPAAPAVHERKNSSLLFVDDRVDLMEVIIMMIENMGITVQRATSYEDGKEAFLSQPFDFCIIDAELKRGAMDGRQLAAWISENYLDVTVFIFSGHRLEKEEIPPRVIYIEKGNHAELLSKLAAIKKHNDAQFIA